MAIAPARTDCELLERLRRRDRTAWDEVYRTYEQRLYGFAYRLSGNPHDAADLVQETFVRALPRLDRLPPERANIGAYLFATAKNLFLKQVERAKRTQPVDEVPEPDEPGDIEEDPQRAALLRRQQREVRIANGKLAPRQRLVLALRELEDKSYAEIGELVGLNENAVAQLISRARLSLREELRLVQVDRSKLAAECQGYLPLLSAHLDGQLKGASQKETLAHLEACEDCQKALVDMEEARRRYRALVPPVVAIVALREKVDDALAASGYWETDPENHDRSGPSGRGGHRRGRRLAVLVAGLAILAGIGAGYTTGFGQAAPTTEPAAAAEPASQAADTGSVSGASAPSGEQPSSSAPSPGAEQKPATATDEARGSNPEQQPEEDEDDPTAVGDAAAGGGGQPDRPAAGAGADGDGGGSGGTQGGHGSSQGDGGSGGTQDGHGTQDGEAAPDGDGARGDGGRQDGDGDRPADDGGSHDASPDRGDGGGSETTDPARGDDGSQTGDAAQGDDGRGDGSASGDASGDAGGSRGDGSSQDSDDGRDDDGRDDDGSTGGQSAPGDDGSRGDGSREDGGAS